MVVVVIAAAATATTPRSERTTPDSGDTNYNKQGQLSVGLKRSKTEAGNHTGCFRQQIRRPEQQSMLTTHNNEGQEKKNRPSMTRPLPLQLNNGMVRVPLATAGGHSRCVLPALNQTLTIR
ncbi:hypothetical protein T10_5587 [Trichinella papuae]|uniref:Uncharacterized protein n=1 Tax=Trichinella papuae TaxID=268474 RepID=A0A0V1MAR4_9BILA|nr:hypothetical protein T10_5587 [Trichinella papuae]